jgi:hypothetical protein
MKNLAFLLLLSSLVRAQKPEKIYPFARHFYTAPYLTEQSTLWKKEVDKDRKNREAWYNYYYANRNLLFADTARVVRQEREKYISRLIDDMGEAIPESYEYNLCRWLHGRWNMKLISYLEKAQQLGPERPEHLDFSIVLAEMKGDRAKRDKWVKLKFDAGQFSTGLLYYNYNVLAGLPENAIIITSGDNDTYPIWYLQSMGIRPDVDIFHTSLNHIKEYRDALSARLEIKSLDGADTPWHTCEGNRANVVTWLSGQTRRPVCVGLTAHQNVKSAPAENLYLTGLAYAYSTTPIDNMAVLKRNFEKEYALDYLEKSFFPDISSDLVKIVNTNYIVPMLKLFEHYRVAGDYYQTERIRRLLLSIAKDTTYESEVKKKIASL